MNFKTNDEKDPNRCRDLRQSDRRIRNLLPRTNASLRATIDRVKELRAQRGRMKDKVKDLSIQIAGATFASGGSGPVGSVIGVSASTLSIQLEVLKSNIDAVQKKVDEGKEKVISLKSDITGLETDLTQNSAQLNALNCVK